MRSGGFLDPTASLEIARVHEPTRRGWIRSLALAAGAFSLGAAAGFAIGRAGAAGPSSERSAGLPGRAREWAHRAAVGPLDELVDMHAGFLTCLRMDPDDALLWEGAERMVVGIVEGHPADPSTKRVVLSMLRGLEIPAGRTRLSSALWALSREVR